MISTIEEAQKLTEEARELNKVDSNKEKEAFLKSIEIEVFEKIEEAAREGKSSVLISYNWDVVWEIAECFRQKAFTVLKFNKHHEYGTSVMILW